MDIKILDTVKAKLNPMQKKFFKERISNNVIAYPHLTLNFLLAQLFCKAPKNYRFKDQTKSRKTGFNSKIYM